MHGRGNDVCWRLIPQLDDIFTKIGFHRSNAIGFERMIQSDFLTDHGFRFSHQFRVVPPGNTQDNLNSLSSIDGAVD
jgi:hypothetical protein